MAIIPKTEGTAFDITAEEKHELGIKWQDVFYVVIGLVLLFLLISPLPSDFESIGLGAIRVNTKTIIVVLMILLYIQRTIVRFNEYERGVVLRLGRFDRIAGPGWSLVFPLLETYFKVDLRLQVYNIPPQEVVTRDKVRFMLSPEIFMYVNDPKAAILNVDDYKHTTLGYVNSSLTHDCGNSTSDYIITHMDDLTHSLEDRINHVSNESGKEWGVKIVKIKLTLVRFPDSVQDAMHEKVASEQLKLAAHEKAEATKIEIDAIREAGSKLTSPAITYMYLEALDKVARGRATKIVLPLEVSKIAETISKSTGDTVTPAGLPLEMLNKYKDAIDKYDERLGRLEGKLVGGESEKVITDSDRVIEDKTVDGKTDYEKKVRDIKRRLDLDGGEND
ncbi:MAG: SPFH domain-containing protein [Candidatus Altiarchaeota archaeon]|nr:SPFH domain-containing protein [Candidatus Altiarchaeota archaeon]